jgi:hypothetical protein
MDEQVKEVVHIHSPSLDIPSPRAPFVTVEQRDEKCSAKSPTSDMSVDIYDYQPTQKMPSDLDVYDYVPTQVQPVSLEWESPTIPGRNELSFGFLEEQSGNSGQSLSYCEVHELHILPSRNVELQTTILNELNIVPRSAQLSMSGASQFNYKPDCELTISKGDEIFLNGHDPKELSVYSLDSMEYFPSKPQEFEIVPLKSVVVLPTTRLLSISKTCALEVPPNFLAVDNYGTETANNCTPAEYRKMCSSNREQVDFAGIGSSTNPKELEDITVISDEFSISSSIPMASTSNGETEKHAEIAQEINAFSQILEVDMGKFDDLEWEVPRMPNSQGKHYTPQLQSQNLVEQHELKGTTDLYGSDPLEALLPSPELGFQFSKGEAYDNSGESLRENSQAHFFSEPAIERTFIIDETCSLDSDEDIPELQFTNSNLVFPSLQAPPINEAKEPLLNENNFSLEEDRDSVVSIQSCVYLI